MKARDHDDRFVEHSIEDLVREPMDKEPSRVTPVDRIGKWRGQDGSLACPDLDKKPGAKSLSLPIVPVVCLLDVEPSLDSVDEWLHAERF